MGNGHSRSLYFNIFIDKQKVKSHAIHISSDEFTHIAATFGDGKISIYKNGKLLEEVKENGSYYLPDMLLRIGGISWSTNIYPFNGMLDEFHFYSRVLQEGEIQNLNALSNIPNDKDHILYYPFNGDVKDYSGNAIDAVKQTLIASMAFSPDGRLFFTEKDTGNIRMMKDDKVIQEPFYHVSGIWAKHEQGLLGLAIDPKFKENHYVYFYYTYNDTKSDNIYNRVVRIVDNDGKGENPVVILDKIYASDGFHSGGAMAFGPDNKLYITVGDATAHPFAMDPNIMIGKVLRINGDGTIPSDNPYPNSPVYNMGHRNMFGIAFSPNGFGIVTENGDGLFDEINDIQKGANYGFPLIQPPNTNPFLAKGSESVMPLVTFRDTIAPTQAIHYDGNKFPDLQGKFIFGAFDGGIFALDINETSKKVKNYERIFVNRDLLEPVIGIAQSPNGDIYYGAYSIYKLQNIDASTKSRSLLTITVSTDSNDVPAKEIRIDPPNNKIVITPMPGKKSTSDLLMIRMLVSVTNVIDHVEDINGTKLNFTTTIRPPYFNLDTFVNTNTTSIVIPNG